MTKQQILADIADNVISVHRDKETDDMVITQPKPRPVDEQFDFHYDPRNYDQFSLIFG